MAGLFLFLLISSLNAAAAEPLKTAFPEGKGKALVQATCTRCHASVLVLQNRMDRAGWDSTLNRMQKNGLGELTPSARAQILDYLEAQLSPKSLTSTIDGELGPRPVNPLPEG